MQAIDTIIEEIVLRLAQAGGETRRLFHGRGGCFPGLEHLAIDWLPPVAVVRLYDEVPAGWLQALSDNLRQLPQIASLVIQQRSMPGAPQDQLSWGECDARQEVLENGLRYQVQPLGRQNSGLFLDMRTGRRWVQQQASGKRVLNLFAYTCAFSVAALAGGAEHVVNLDMASGALKTGKINHRLNGIDLSGVTFLAHDLFRSWKRIRDLGPYDLVVLDPPSFQRGSFVATKDYQRVLLRLETLVKPGGRVLACHNDPARDSQFLKQLMADSCPDFSFEQRLDNPDDFPEQNPEQGLKALIYQRTGRTDTEALVWS